ncbi:uncharacterized protein METZ01_LOCUS514394 [marine metagenome]|uniref:Uncharacterized protein n=1 Tax=marine metagenome TaxID=408172 RepID=A0A383EZ50_9ZZZZ
MISLLEFDAIANAESRLFPHLIPL